MRSTITLKIGKNDPRAFLILVKVRGRANEPGCLTALRLPEVKAELLI
jgi:hypothetical protein